MNPSPVFTLLVALFWSPPPVMTRLALKLLNSSLWCQIINFVCLLFGMKSADAVISTDGTKVRKPKQ